MSLSISGIAARHAVVRWIKAPNGVASPAKNTPIQPDSLGNASFQFSPGCITAVGIHELWVEDDATDARSNRIAVNVTPESRCGGSLPDLVAESLTIETPSVVRGAMVTVSVVIRNDGQSPSPPFKSRLRLSVTQRTSVRDVLLLSFDTTPLQPRTRVVRRFEVQIPPDMTPGSYFITSYLDYLGNVLEEDNDNNAFASTRPLIVVSK